MAYRKNEILIYTDLFDEDQQVVYLETSDESGNHKVKFGEREIWLRPPQLKGTGKIYEKPLEDVGTEKKKGWEWGDAIPEHAYKKKKKRS
jgi:hypothetical protein